MTPNLTFWREEYQLDRRIKTYPKPIVALVDGIVMGGGVGLAMHAAHTVAGERFVFAMPEVGIGFFPDVGAAWLSAASSVSRRRLFRTDRAAGRCGRRPGVGSGGDLCPERSVSGAGAGARNRGAGQGRARPLRRASAPFDSDSEAEAIEACFSGPDRDAILDALGEAETEGRAFAAPARVAMLEKSPTSQAIALRQMELGATT